MAVDLDLLNDAETGHQSLRFYTWNGPWVSLGRFQNPEVDLLDPSLVPWVMRPTGGKAVLHGHDLTITIACPHNGIGVKAIYRSIVRPLIEGLRNSGQPAALGEETAFVGKGTTADCFKHVSVNDVVDPTTGRKLIGCALKVTRKAALAQCSVPISMPVIDPARVYRQPHVALPLGIDPDSLADEIAASIEQCRINEEPFRP